MVDALESDLVVQDPDGPVEVFARSSCIGEASGSGFSERRWDSRSHFNVSNSVEADPVMGSEVAGRFPVVGGHQSGPVLDFG